MRVPLIAIVFLTAVSPLQAWGSTNGDPFTNLFAFTCMKHFYSHDQLRAQMASSDTPVMPAAKAAFFLGGEPGTAWAVLEQGERYVVALRSDGVCAVYAQHAPIDTVQKNFVSLVSSSPAPLVADQRDSATSGPNGDGLHTIAYSWSRPADKTELIFTLTTSEDASPVQAMASMANGQKKPNQSSKRTR